MENIKAKNGQIITDEMIASWCADLDADQWPEGEHNIGPVITGRPPLSPDGAVVLSVKIPPAMKLAVEKKANTEGVSTSAMVRSLLAAGLIDQ